MTPEEMLRCDELLEHPLLKTPPPEPEKPRPPYRRRPRVFNLPPRFNLITVQFYQLWCNHLKELQMMKHIVDDNPPPLYPELYLKPRRLDFYGHQLQENMKVNKELLKRINIIQRSGGFVDCWNTPQTSKRNKLMCKTRQLRLNEIQKQNFNIYQRLLLAHSEQPCTKDLAVMWESTKHKLILGAQQEFILFKQGSLDKDIYDPAFNKPPDVYRPRVSIEVWVRGGSKIGRVTVELFTDIAPSTCKFFLTLIKGDPNGYAYTGTRIFRSDVDGGDS